MRDGAGPSQTGRLKSNVEERGENGSAYSKERWDTLKTPEEEEEKKTTLFDIALCISKQEIHRTKGSKEGRLITGGT